MGELDDRVDPLLGLDPRVRRAPLDLQGEVADALARRLQPAARQGRLHHEHVGARPRLFLDQGARGRAADLLVGREQHDDRPRRPRRERTQGAEGVFHQHEAALHVIDARPVGASALDAERHLRQRADLPDRVVVAEDQRRRSRVGRVAQAHPQVIAAGRIGQALDVQPDRREPPGEPARQRVERGLVPAGRLVDDERLDRLEHRGRSRPEIIQIFIIIHEIFSPSSGEGGRAQGVPPDPLLVRPVAEPRPGRARGRPLDGPARADRRRPRDNTCPTPRRRRAG